MAHLSKDTDGHALARIEFTAFGFPTGKLILSDVLPAEALQLSVPGYYRHGQDLYLRVRVHDESPPSQPFADDPFFFGRERSPQNRR